MKTIQMSDSDYDSLMELAKELQVQDNVGQGFPYFWSPRSTKSVIGGEDDTPMVFDDKACKSYSLKEYAKIDKDAFAGYLDECFVSLDTDYGEIDEDEWAEYLECSIDLHIFHSKDEDVTEQNPSLFHSDVKQFVKQNAHNLGKNPHAYAQTIHRMPKMQKLVEIIYRINKQPVDEVNHEARRFVYPKNGEG